MTDTPKRIWVKGWSHTGEAPSEIIGTFSNRLPGTEYVRLDLVVLAIEAAREHRDLMRAAHDLCHALLVVKHHMRSGRMRAKVTIPLDAAAELTALWELCKDFAPTEVEQGLVPIPVEYNER